MAACRSLPKLLKNVSVLTGIVILAGCSMNQVGLGAKVDITPPKLAITSPTADGLYTKGTVHLSGTVSDDLGLKSVVVTYPTATGDQSKTAPVNGTGWTLDLASGAGGVLKDGAANISVTATDNSGKLVTQTRLVYVDNLAPTVLLQSPSAWDPVANKAPIYTDYIDIKGEVYDASPLTQVKVMLYGPGDSLLATHTADGTNTFSTRFYLKASNGPVAALLGGGDDGKLYTYTVQATDKAGNTNSYTFHRQDIYKAMTASAVAAGTVFPTVNDIGDLDNAGTGTSPGGITFANLSAVHQDLAPAAYDFAFQYTSAPNIQFVNVDPSSPLNTLGVNAILTATIQPPATAGSAIDPSSVVTKVYALPDTTSPVVSITGSGTNLDLRSVGDSYSYSLTLKKDAVNQLDPGPYRLVLSAQATGSSVATKSVDFFIDSGAPYLSKGATTNTSGYISTHTTLGGSANSPTGLAKIDIYQLLNGSPYPDANPIQTIPLSGSNATWASNPLPPSGVPDGSYDYTVTLTTTSNKTTSVFHSFTYDTTLPTVSVNGITPLVGSGAIAGAATAFAFGASDTNGITEVRWWLLPAASAAPTWTTVGFGSFTKPPYTATNFDSTAVAEGAKKLWVLAHDKAGNEASASADLQVDQTPPSLAVAGTAATVNAASAAAFTGFTGTASDTNALASLAVSVDSGASQAITVTAGTWAFPWTINASTHAQDGAHSFTFTAVDAAGRSSTVVRSLTVDTKAPTTTVTSPAASGWALSASLSALGTATDGTSGTGTSAVYVKADALYVASGATDHSTEDPTVGGNGWTLATSTSSWTASLSLTGEGRKTLWIKALDAAGNLTDAATAVASRVDFGLDLLPPILGFSDGVGTLVNSGYTLTGTTSDTNPAAAPTVSVSVDAGAGQALTVTAGAWTLPFTVNTVTHAQDGTHTFVFTATDVAGKTATLTRTITVDTTSPTVTISQPSSALSSNPAYWLSGATASFGGSSSDSGTGTSGVASVYFKVDTKGTSHASDTPNASWTLAAGTTTWSTTVNLTGLGEGEFTLWTAAYDNVGNLSSFTQRDFGIDQSSPTLSETSRAASSASKVAFTLTGTAADSNALATLTITESKDGGAANAVTFTPTPAIAGSGSSTYTTQSLPRAGVADGSYAYVLKATDVAGKTVTVNRTVVIDTTAPNVALTAVPAWITSAAYTISGTASDPGTGATGIKEIDYSLDGGAWVPASGSTTWSAILTGLAEGTHTLAVRAVDQAANTTTLSAVNFGVDLSAPTVTETSIPSSAQVYRTGAFTLTGTVGDANPASVAGTTLTVTVTVNGGAPTAATLGGSTWSYNQSLADGTYSYVITATDAAGRTATVNRLVLLDSTAPTLTVTTPTPGTWKSTTALSLSGTGQDGAGSGILKSYFLVDAAANDHSGDIATWNGTSGASAPVSGTSATWAATSGLPTSWTGSTTLSGEGQKTLWVVAVDKAGNSSTLTSVAATSLVNGTTYTIATIGTTDFTLVGAASNTVGLSFVATGPGSNTGTAWTGTAVLVPLGLDLAAPTLSESTVGTASTVVRSSTVAFGGNAADSNALAAAHNLTLSVDNAAATDVAFTVAPAWTASYPVNTVTHAQDGTHSFLFTATDVAGKTTTLTRSVLVDTTPASVTVSSPAPGLNTNATSLSLAGSSNDGTGSGVAEVWYRIDASANDHSADAYNAAGWTKATGTTTWSATATGLTEGAKKLWVKTLDSAGNVTSASGATAGAVNFTVDLTAPVLAETNIGAATVNKNVAFTFGGAGALSTATDALSGVGTLKVTDNGGSTSTVTVTGGNWSYAVSSLPADGTHTYLFTLTDLAGNQTTMTRTVVVDSSPAAYTVTSPTAALNTNNTSISLAGSANDGAGSGVAEVWYRIDAAANNHSADVYNSAGWTKATGTTTWSASVTGLTEGAKKLWVKTLDNAGNVTTAAQATAGAVAFTVDLTAPVLAETNIGAATVNKNGGFTFGGAGALSTATDALSGINTLTVIDNGSGSTAVTVTAGKWSYAPSAPSEGTHTYLFTLTDLAGNQATLTRTVVVDTTPASFTVNTPSSGQFTNSTSLSLAGSANDGSGSGVAEVWYRIDASANDHSADAYNAAGWTKATGTTAWSASVTGLTEGAKKLWVKTLDNAGNVTAAATALASAVAFTVDLTAPVLAETNIGATTVHKNVAFTFGGAGALSSATDALSGINTLTVTDNGGPASAVTVTAGKWSYAVSSLPADGTHTYLFTLTDLAGNQATMTRTVVVDTASAAFTVNTPAAGLFSNSTSLSLAGSANDGSGSGVAEVWYRIDASANDHSADAYNAAGWTKATGTTTWSATATGLTEGAKKLWVKTLDSAGNVTSASGATAGAVNFTVDLTAPVLAETNIGATTVNKNVAFTFGGAGALSSATDALSGINTLTVTDNGGPGSAVTVTAGKWSYAVSSLPADGTHTYLFTLTDLAGNQATLTRTVVVDTTPATATVSAPTANLNTNNSTLSLAGSANDGAGSGVKEVWYRIDTSANDHSTDAYNAAGWTQATGTTTWSATASGLTEGTKKLWVKTLDNAGNVTTAASALASAVAFTVDLTVPVLTESNIGAAPVNKNVGFTFGGAGALSSATDALSGVGTLKVADNGGAPTVVPVTLGNWSYTVSSLPADGTHTYVFTLTDQAGNPTTLSRLVVVDTAPASATVVAPAASSYAGASLTLTGSANDGAGSGIKEVWYRIDTAATDHSTDAYNAAGWTQATGTTNWTATATGLTEGAKKLWVKTLDNTGNVTPAATALAFAVPFTVDLTAPSLTETAVGAGASVTGSFTFSGLASDTIGLAASHAVQVSVDGGAAVDVTGTTSWSYAVTVNTSTHANDGTHTYAFTATDLSGKVTTLTRTVVIDTSAPDVTYNNISGSGGTVLQDTSGKVTGTLSSSSGLASSATATLQQYHYTSASWSTVTGFNAVSLGITGTPKTFSWTVDLGAANLPDGKYRLALVVPNAGTPTLTLDTTSAPVTFVWSRANPAVTISAPGLGTFQNGDFPLAGTAFDANTVSSVVAKVSSGAVDFSSGTTPALAALPVTLNLATSTFSTASAHGLIAGDPVYLYGSPMPTATINGVTGTMKSSIAYLVNTVTATTLTLKDGSGYPVTINTNLAPSLILASAKFTFVPTSLTVTASSGNPNLSTATVPTLGQAVNFVSGPLPTGLSGYLTYYVVAVGAGTFQVSATPTGSAITPTSGATFSMAQPVGWLVPSMATTSLADGSQTAYLQITSTNSGKSTVTTRDFTLDKSAPTISLTSPASGTRSVGNLTLVGTTTDSGAIPSGVTGTIQYQIGKSYNLTNAGSWTNANVSGGAYSWTISLGDMSAYANSTFAVECDTLGNAVAPGATNLWKLPIVFQALDKAGNVSQLTSYFLILDPDGNLPVVNVTQPATGLTFGGQYRVAGTASQPIYIHDVEVAIDPTGGNNFPANPISLSISGTTVTANGHPFTNGMMVYFGGTTRPQIGGSTVSATTPYWVVNPTANTFQVSATSGGSPVTFSSAGTAVTGSVWGPAVLTTNGPSVIWYYDANSTSAYPQGGATSQTVTLQARAWNSPTVAGSRGTISGLLTTPLVMSFNSSFPQAQNLQVGGQGYYAQMTTRGQFTLTGTLSSSKGISKVEVVESSPMAGSTDIYKTSTSYGTTNAANGLYWSSTVTPPTTKTSNTYANGNTTKVMITATGSNPALWTAAGAVDTVPGTVFTPNNTSLNVGASGGSFIESDGTGTFNYGVSLTIDSTKLYSNTTGQYGFLFRMTDMTSPTAQVSTASVILNEDNYYPTSTQASPGLVSAGSFQPGTRYTIVSLGGTDFTLLGASANSLGLNFVATGTGASNGTGTALPVLTGTNFKVQGSATDIGGSSGSIQGMSKVVVYLTNPAGTQVLDMKTGGASVAASSTSAMDMANAGVIGPVPYPSTASYSNYFASIDTLAEIGLTDANGDGFLESYTINGNNRDWWAQVDTTKLADGPLTLHYVIWDQAGNATHYAQAAFISNNAPSLTSIDVGTDINGDASVSAGEITNFPVGTNFATTGFSVRNSRLYFQANYSHGSNTPVMLSVKYAGIERNAILTNHSVTITDFTTNPIPDSAGTNDRVFTLFLYDSTPGTVPGTNSQSFVQTVALTIKNNDTSPPKVDLSPFGKRWTAPLDAANGNVNTDAGKALQAVSAYTDNVGGSLGSLTGHVEYASDSKVNPLAVTLATPGTGSFTNTGTNNLAKNAVVYFAWTTPPSSSPNGTGPYYVIGTPTATAFQVSATKGGTAAAFGTGAAGVTLASPDLSGTVIFRGKLYDDQRVASVKVTIPGYNSGNPVTLATWSAAANANAGGLVPVTSDPNWTFTLDGSSESVSQADGHAANWAFAFDTSKIATVAATNVPVTFTVTDGGGNTDTTGTTVDIVPYITDFSRQTPFVNRLSDNPANSNKMNPGADGYYPVYQNTAGYLLKGFNLLYGTASATVGATALTVTASSTTSLTVTIPASLTMAGGANLTVTTNAVASTNNLNDNAQAYNSSLSEGAFTDDRKVYIDDLAPTIAVAPFGQTYPATQVTDDATGGLKVLGPVADYTDNVPYAGSDKTVKANWKGHVEYAEDNPVNTNRPALSGMVTFKGKAADNQRINRLTVTIGDATTGFNSGTEFNIYTLAGGALSGTGWSAAVDGNDNTLSSSRVAAGHVLNWNFTWDTTTLNKVAATGVVLTFKAYDANNTPLTATTSMTVDIVPYVSRVETRLSAFYSSTPSVFNRTALGHYPVAEGETITLTGFNLNGTNTTVSINSTANGVTVANPTAVLASALLKGYPYTITSVGTTNFTLYGAASNTVGASFVATAAGTGTGTATMDVLHSARVSVGSLATQASGALVVSVNGVSSQNNNANTAARAWNQVPNGVNNNNLNDDLYLDLWKLTEVTRSEGGGINMPSMKVSRKGSIGFSFGNSVVWFSMPGKMNSGDDAGQSFRSQTPFQKDYGWFTSNDFAFDDQDNTYGVALCPDTSANAGQTANFSFFSRVAGNPVGTWSLNGNYNAEGSNNWRWANTSITYDSTTKKTDIFRVQSPSIVTSMPIPGSAANDTTNKTNIYVAWYDQLTQQIRYRYGTVGSTPSSITTSLNDMGNVTAANGVSVGSGLPNYPKDVGTAYYQVVASTAVSGSTAYNTTTAVQPGQYVAAGVVPRVTANAGKDVLVIAWYNSTSRQLYLSYNTDPSNTAGSAAQWQTNARVVDSTISAGLNVKMAVDSDGGIHLAYYSAAGGDLKYAYLTSYDQLTGGTLASIATVDSFLSVGTNCTIDVAKVGSNQVPYLSYAMAANFGTTASTKVAYRTDFTTNATGQFDGADSSSFFTGDWEVSIIPTGYTPVDAQVNVGVYRNASGLLTAIPTGTNTLNAVQGTGYLASKTSTIFGNGTTNPVVGYAVQENGILEMAQRK